MTYNVRLPIFEGPFDLLLHLIKVNEMDIYDIPIADITQKYLEYIQQIQELDLDVAGEFLVIASHLVSMKARQLLPAAEEDVQPEDTRDDAIGVLGHDQSPRDFMRQLIAYRKFKDLARQLSRREADQARVYYRSVPPPAPPLEPIDIAEEATPGLSELIEAFSRVLRYVDEQAVTHQVSAERYTVEDKIVHLEELFAQQKQIDVTEEFGRCLHKVEMIVTFLAILELTRLKRVRIVQDEAYGHIAIEAIEAAEVAGAEPTSG